MDPDDDEKQKTENRKQKIECPPSGKRSSSAGVACRRERGNFGGKFRREGELHRQSQNVSHTGMGKSSTAVSMFAFSMNGKNR